MESEDFRIAKSYVCRVCGQGKRKYRTNTRRTAKEWNYIDDNGKRVQGSRCFECMLSDQRKRRSANGNNITKRYEKTPRGFLMRLYRNMKSRVDGVQSAKHHLYEGKELLSRSGFYEWADVSPVFHALYANYVASGFDRKLAPSVDRIDSSQGYVIGNMRWLTMAENSRLGAVARAEKYRGQFRPHKITRWQAQELVVRRLAGEPAKLLALEFGITTQHVYDLSTRSSLKLEQTEAQAGQPPRTRESSR